MVTHFLSESGQAACGRGDSNVNGSSDVGQVSCKTCRRTNAFAQAQENAAPASAPVTPTAAAPVTDKAAPRPKAPPRPPRRAETSNTHAPPTSTAVECQPEARMAKVASASSGQAATIARRYSSRARGSFTDDSARPSPRSPRTVPAAPLPGRSLRWRPRATALRRRRSLRAERRRSAVRRRRRAPARRGTCP
ncbi:hypothetical protein M770_10470 [Pseudomonas aeruginosa VRFPA03]|nr:hypothetical protein M770_10470 [Pseudomonas aeruginosa VRFPA03]